MSEPDVVVEIAAKSCVGADDVLRLRREVFRDGVVDRVEAEAAFRLDRACARKDQAWIEFYVDALTDYLVWKAQPRGYVSDENAQFLIDHIVHDGKVDETTELELLVNVIHWAQSCPEALVVFVLEAVRDSVLDPDAAAYGSGRRPGVIDPVDVEIIRKVIYAGASGGGFTVTRREAELLFDLNNATVEAENAGGWRDLFVKAIANHLMFPRGAPVVPDAKEHARREAWLEQRRGVGRLLLGVGRALGRLEMGGAWREADLLGLRRDREAAEREAARLQESLARESIDAAEAKWLIGRIDQDAMLHDNERAVLVFIKQNAPHIHPSLNELFVKLGL
jgi:hypothetical protein